MVKSKKAIKEERIQRDAEQRKIYAEAKDPSTNPTRLREIYSNGLQKEWLEEALAENPNTPLSVLLSVALRHPAKVLKNPVLSLLHLENPDFLKQGNEEALISLLRAPEAPQWLVEYATTYPDLGVVNVALEHPNLPTNLIEKFIQQNKGTDGMFNGIVQNPKLPIDLLRTLANDKDPHVRHRVAQNLSTTAELLETILKSTPPDSKYFAQNVPSSVAQHPNTSVAILSLLAKNKDPKIRQGVAKNTKAPLSILTSLFSDKDPDVQKALSQNPSIPLDLIENMALKKPPKHWVWFGVFLILALSAVAFYFMIQSLRPGESM